MAEPEKRVFYQVSFTRGQGVTGLVIACLALAAAFYLGVRAGLSSRAGAPASPEARAAGAARPLPAPETPPAPVPSAAPPESVASIVTAPAPGGASGPVEFPAFEDREAPAAETAGASGSTGPAPETRVARKPQRPAPAPRATAQASPRKAPRPAPAANYVVQLLSTTSRAEARVWKRRLARKGIHAVISSVSGRHGRLFRVRVGPYATKEKAKRMAERISSEFHRQAWVAPE